MVLTEHMPGLNLVLDARAETAVGYKTFSNFLWCQIALFSRQFVKLVFDGAAYTHSWETSSGTSSATDRRQR